MKARPQGWRSFTAFLLPLLLGALLAPPAAAVGNPDETYPFHIEKGGAEVRLNEFSTQSGLQMLFNYEVMKGIPTKPVKGEYKPFDALNRMIAGTEIKYEFINKRTVTLTLAVSKARNPPVPRKEGNARQSRVADRRAPDADVEVITILSEHPTSLPSTGSSLLSLKRAEIDALGYATVPGVVRTLPQVFGGGPTEDTDQFGTEARTNSTRGNGINLRGLGASSTLILLNGHRLGSSGTEGLFVDVSNLPLAAVERMDILPDSSSTFYGADAVGGVVNFVMRDRFDGQQTETYFGTATEGPLDENYISQIVGVRTDSSYAMAAFDFYSRDNLPASYRAQARSDLTAFGGSNFDVLQSNPGNITLGPLTWAIPRGQDGKSLEASDFQPGTKNLTNVYDRADVLPSQQRWSFFGTGRAQITERLSLFGDALFGQRNVHNTGNGQVAQFVVPTTNPFYVNPTGVPGPVTVSYNFIDDLGTVTSTARILTSDMVGGFELKPGTSWRVTGTVGHASERARAGLANVVDRAKLLEALAQTDPEKAFNPFGDGSNSPAGVLSSIRTERLFTSRSTVESAGLIASGPIMALGGGDVTLSVGGDSREQTFRSGNQITSNSPALITNLSRTVHSAFAEVLVPLIGIPNRMRGVESLDISLAERYERYSDFGETLAARFGLSWVPVHGLTVRGTYSESFRPPGLLDLDESTNFFTFLPLSDPQNGSFSNVLIWGGKNRDLHEETARSWTAGLEVEPVRLPGAAVALTYFNTKFVDRLDNPVFALDVLSNPTQSPLVTRNPSPELRAEVCARAPQASTTRDCLTTPIAAIVDLRVRNDARMQTSGFDLLGRYSMDSSIGKLSFGLNGTYILDFSEARTRLLPLENKVSTPHYPVNLRMRGLASWQRGGAELSLSLNYQNSYLDTLSVPRRHVESWTTADFRTAYTFGAAGQGMLGDTTISFAVNNLLDTDPPFLNNAFGVGYDQENGDLTGRVVSLTLRKRW
jgi:iron complex outermembrane recepter protein